MTHTKGEWEVVIQPMSTLSTEIKANKMSICLMSSGSSEVNKANAKLITAAPELLKVCESIEEVYSELMADDSPKLPIRKFEYIAKLMSKSREAIKKATQC